MRIGLFLFNLLLAACLLVLPCIKTAKAERRAASVKRDYPQGYFGQPMDIPMRLAGNFGELRSNHFHAGIDVKTEGQENLNLYALADGYVSRVVTSPRGYGNAVYIDYPNGYTSVFAHINSFTGQIGAYVKNRQYELQRFEIDERVPPNLLPVTRGQVVAKSGNTGSSHGPHLHFELRDSFTEEAINPLLFGYKVPDDVKPTITQMALYKFVSPTAYLPDAQVFATRLLGGEYGITQPVVKVNVPKVGVSIKSFDRKTGVHNTYNVYALKMYDNGKEVYAFEMERIGFDESRYINAHIDYRLKKEGDGYFQKCFVEPYNRLSIYRLALPNGVIDLADGLPHKIVVEATDINKNTATLAFTVQYDPALPPPPADATPYNALFTANADNTYQNDFFKLSLPAGSLYNNLYFQYNMTSGNAAANVYSPKHQVHYNTTPVHRYFDIGIKPDNLPFELYDYALVAFTNHTGKEIALSSRWEGNFLTAQSRELGNYYITTDTKPPTIKSINLLQGKYMGKNKTIEMQISDNLSGIAAYNGYIDNRWVLMEYDQKTARLWHTFDERSGTPGAHQFRLTVTDAKGNTAEYKAGFSR